MEEGKLQFDLYHGTSSVDLSSIREHGLGGRNLIEELNVVEFLAALYSVAEEVLPTDHAEWAPMKVILEPMVNQRVTKGGFNFRHGKTYLSASRIGAARYAATNPHGSELLTSTKCLYDLVVSFAPGAVEEIADWNPLLSHRLQQTGEAIVLQIPALPLGMLKSESGGSADVVVRQYERLKSRIAPELLDEMTGQVNFELRRPVPFASLLMYKVSTRADGSHDLLRTDTCS